ncbi:MAG: hypothetical protein N3D85_05950 [Candidatus Bathyarchaeota archaeon]|nr:hypothetical protein [Candidatus Bathyarchaeota archaeon]
MKAFNVAVIAICASLYAVVGYLTSFGLTFGGVAFWPAAFIPAVFAVLFGSWVGGVGAAIGIFIRDLAFHGDPFLSLTAGVTANFTVFFMIGYLSKRNLDRKKTLAGLAMGSAIILVGLLLPTLLLPVESAGFAPFSTFVTLVLFTSLVGVSLFLFALMTKYWREFRSFGVGSVIGMGVGAAVVAVAVWAYSQLFYSPTGYFASPLSASLVPLIFVWTFATEIPFVLLLAPPIIKACRKAFPQLCSVNDERAK